MTPNQLRVSESSTHPAESRTRSVFLERGLDTSNGLGFVRERLALVGKTLFVVSFGFYLFLLASMTLVGGAPFIGVVTNPVAVGHLAASLTMALLWLITSRALTQPSALSLGRLDAVSFVLACSFLSLMTVNSEGQILQVLLALTVTVMIRAILVPSRPGRTVLLSALAFLPTVIVCIVRHHPTTLLPGFTAAYQKQYMTLNTILWSVLGTTLATITSRVTYGLRKQVAEANELGQYILEEKIGGGGMGEVWRARHRLLIRPAAIKLIRPEVSGDGQLLLRRFEREARATASLKSPHTVQLYDFGSTEDGRLYYVMELLDGLDLDTLVRQYGPQPAERVVHLLRQVSASLQDAHQNGLVHRDIKPANVMVSRGGITFDFAKVLDFGLVKLDTAGRAEAGELQPSDIKLSTDGSTSGTPAFMAPEVVLGASDTDHRVDLYALGCLAYWLLTGKLVFNGRNAVEVMFHHAHTPAPRPSTKSELPIPAPLEELIMECLEKDPARRPESAKAVSIRLAAIPLESAWTLERAEHWWGMHRPADTRPVADLLLSQEGREFRIGRRVVPKG
ncbi:MAG TPA: serine/threonine-protein kinase [Gemmatimonadales bacterium]|nr:serine/threonine-protein kinase [Gemmatimonadales bacterium]